jgi:spermidine synthase
VLVLGGGDGLAVREILRHPQVESITLVDLDPAMTNLAAEFPPLGVLNEGALADPRVHVVNRDAFVWLEECLETFDTAIVDFPDPNTFALGKLYTTRFYRLLKARLRGGSAAAIQCTSPLAAPASFWCIVSTLEAAGFRVWPYQAAVPSFGVWGFALVSTAQVAPPAHMPAPLSQRLRFLNSQTMRGLFELPADIARRDVEINRLDNQMLVRYYESEWSRWH